MIRRQYIKSEYKGHKQGMEAHICEQAYKYGYELTDMTLYENIKEENRSVYLARFEINIAGIVIKSHEFCIRFEQINICPEFFVSKDENVNDIKPYTAIISHQNKLRMQIPREFKIIRGIYDRSVRWN